jgi:glycosyltransferase involved in cell wall biosynthesis
MISLLGVRDSPVDAIEDYCTCVSGALGRQGQPMQILRVPWAEQGWFSALAWLWREAENWRGSWVILHYTALMWSRRGFPLGALAVFWVLWLRGTNRAVVFHDALPYSGTRFVDRVRCAYQVGVMRALFRAADRVITTIAPSGMPWIRGKSKKATCVPVGGSIPQEEIPGKPVKDFDGKRTVAIFSVTGAPQLENESAEIAYVVARAARGLANVRLMLLGRNSEGAGKLLQHSLNGAGIELSVLGLLAPAEITKALATADVLLFVRGHLSSRRSSAAAGIVCGLPVVAYRGQETAPPVTEAGVMLAPEGDRDTLADALGQVLSDDVMRAELRQRSLSARDNYFSWGRIAQGYLQALNCGRLS